MLRYAAEKVTGRKLESPDFHAVRGEDGMRLATVALGGVQLKLAVVHGLKNARTLAEKVRRGECELDLIEVMACPGGCIGGAGQPVSRERDVKRLRTRGLYEADKHLDLHKSQENHLCHRDAIRSTWAKSAGAKPTTSCTPITRTAGALRMSGSCSATGPRAKRSGSTSARAPTASCKGSQEVLRDVLRRRGADRNCRTGRGQRFVLLREMRHRPDGRSGRQANPALHGRKACSRDRARPERSGTQTEPKELSYEGSTRIRPLGTFIDEARITADARPPARTGRSSRPRNSGAKAREMHGLKPRRGRRPDGDAASLTLLEEMFAAARHVKNEIYGNRLVLFAPLYISNLCANECLYCAFRARNKALARRALNMEEIARETRTLIEQGHKRILLVAGESLSADGRIRLRPECHRDHLPNPQRAAAKFAASM